MGKFIVLLAFLIMQTSVAQENTLFNTHHKENGAFGAAVIKFSKINDQNGVLAGAKGGWVINHSLILGGAMYGLVSDVNLDPTVGSDPSLNPDKLHFMYGGFDLGYMFSPMKVFHVAINTLIGIGKVSNSDYQQTIENNYYNNHHAGNSFFVLEPEISLMANVTSFFRFDIGASYLYTAGAEYQNIDDQKVSGLTGFVVLRFGNF